MRGRWSLEVNLILICNWNFSIVVLKNLIIIKSFKMYIFLRTRETHTFLVNTDEKSALKLSIDADFTLFPIL